MRNDAGRPSQPEPGTTTSQDVDVLATQIRARGGELAQEPRDLPWGGREIGLVDPDGFAITIARES